MKTYSAELLAKARNVQVVVLDCDGVLTDNTEVTGFNAPFGHAMLKRRSHYDGQGISLLRAIGIRVVIITGENGPGAEMITALVERWNSLPSVQSGDWKKVDLYINSTAAMKKRHLEEWLVLNEMKLPDRDSLFEDGGNTPLHWDAGFNKCAVMVDDLVDIYLLRAPVGLRACPITAEEVVKEMADFISERPAGYGAVRDLANLILTARGVDPTTLPTK